MRIGAVEIYGNVGFNVVGESERSGRQAWNFITICPVGSEVGMRRFVAVAPDDITIDLGGRDHFDGFDHISYQAGGDTMILSGSIDINRSV